MNKTGEVIVSALSNGLRVATSNVPSHFSALGLYVRAGARFESDELRGCTHFADRLAFRSCQGLPGDVVAERLELLGGNYQCSASRETTMYQASVFNNDVPKMLELMCATVRKPLFTDSEVEEQRHAAVYEIEETWNKPELLLPELLHTAAYGGSTLGAPTMCPPELLPKFKRENLLKYHSLFYRPSNTIAAFVGVSHDKAVEYVQKYLEDWKEPSEPLPKIEKAQYVSGEICVPSGPSYGGLPILHHIHAAFPGLALSDDEICVAALLQILLGGGGSFSAGGPGKGMHSRLYTNVLNKYYFIENCVSFNHAYSDSGLFGISVSCLPEYTFNAVEIVANEFDKLCYTSKESRHGVNDIELQRAKNQLKSLLLMNLESRLIELEDVGKQLVTIGRRMPPADMIKCIDAATTADVAKIARRMFTNTRPTVAMQGERESFGSVIEAFAH